MYIVTNHIDVPAERAEAFEQRFTSNMHNNLPGVAGLVRATLDRPATSGQSYRAIMEFETEADFVAWRESEAFRTSHGGPSGKPSGTEPGPASGTGPIPPGGPERHIRVEVFTALDDGPQ